MSALLYNCVGITAKLCAPLQRTLNCTGNSYYFSQARRFSVLCFKVFMRILGPVMLFIALSLITSILFCFLVYVVPDITEGNMWIFGLHFIGGMFLLINVVFNYIACAFTPPGSPEPIDDPASIMGDRIIVVDGRKVRQIRHAIVIAPAVSYRYCRHCRCIKPPRAHHDSVTGKCVLVMDHYCPWMNNCVGYNNYRHFVLFLLYLGVGCVYVLFVTTHYFSAIVPYQRRNTDSAIYVTVNSAIVYSYTVGLAALISVGLLGSWHLYLSLTNQTTIEFYINMEERSDAKHRGHVFKNPFDKGWRKNLTRVFGNVPKIQALAISLRKPIPEEWPPLPTNDMLSRPIHMSMQV